MVGSYQGKCALMTYQDFLKLHYPTITPTPLYLVVNETVPHGTDLQPLIEDCESLQDTSFNLLLDSHPDCTPVSRDSSYDYIISEEDIF